MRSFAQAWSMLCTATTSFLGNLGFGFRLGWSACRLLMALRFVLSVVMAVKPIAQLWVFKELVDSLIAIIQETGPVSAFWMYVMGLLVVQTVGDVVLRVDEIVSEILNNRVTNHVSSLVMAHALSLDLSFFDSPSYHDEILRSQRDSAFVQRLIWNSWGLVRALVQLAVIAVLLGGLHWSFPIVFIALTVPFVSAEKRFIDAAYGLEQQQAPLERKMSYIFSMLTGTEFAKEIRLFGFGRAMLNRHQDMWKGWFARRARLRIERGAKGLVLSLMPTLAVLGVLAYVGSKAIAGTLTVGSFTFFHGVASQMFESMVQAGFLLMQSYEGHARISSLRHFLDWQPRVRQDGVLEPTVGTRNGHNIEFVNVSFSYPGSSEHVLRNVSFKIRAKERVALVGANGAGKTTIVKLILRFYDPTEGTILLDGQDLRSYNLDKLRKLFGVAFQDFAKYAFTLCENVTLADLERSEDGRRLTQALEQSGADSIKNKLPRHEDTYLSRVFEPDGVELSAGEWQKIALARAFFRDSDILVLDEPTASLDPEAEHEVFERFAALCLGKEAVLISHRLSSVTMADRILVLHGGQIVESGSHEELLRAGGRYAHLFRMQAERYIAKNEEHAG